MDQPIPSLFDRIAGALSESRRMWLFLLISLLLLACVSLINPAKFGGYLWIASKLTGSAAIGYLADVAAFAFNGPAVLEGIEKAMAQTRRATLIAAAMIAAGLMP